MRRFRWLLLVGVLSSGACSSSSAEGTNGAPDGGATVDAEPSPDAGGADASTEVAIPDTPAGRRLAWVLSALNGGSTTDTVLKENFAAAFLADVPPTQIRALMSDMAKSSPWSLRAFEGATTPNALTAAIADKAGTYWRVQLSTDASEKMDGLLFAPAGDLDPALATWEGVEAALAKVAPTATLFAADLDHDCASIRERGAADRVALGSVFKLYVLAELARQVDTGARTFSDEMAIQDQWKSLPSGVLQNEPVGTKLTLAKFAENMISISDNTAADHLLFTLGRENVEAMVTTAGHHAPADMRPFVSTRELFTLKLMLSSSEMDAYVAASETEKRSLLSSYATRDPRTANASGWTKLIRIETLEWFASGKDICKLHTVLKGYGQKTATKPVFDVLSKNPGIDDATGAFSFIGYKGGSEPGVMVMTWMLKRKVDGAWRSLSVAFNDTTNEVDEAKALYVATAARAVLGR